MHTFHMRTSIDSSVYFNARGIIHLYVLLVQINALGFFPISFLRVESIICTLPLVHFYFFCTNYYIFSNFQILKLPHTDLKITFMVLPSVFLPFTPFSVNKINRANLYETYILSLFFSRVAKRPNTQTSIPTLRILYVIESF